jgi:hypothetical protein
MMLDIQMLEELEDHEIPAITDSFTGCGYETSSKVNYCQKEEIWSTVFPLIAIFF